MGKGNRIKTNKSKHESVKPTNTLERNIENFKESLSPEDQDFYRRVGEQMYGVDFNNIEQIQQVQSEELEYLYLQLRAGMHPSMLEDEEKELLRVTHGDTWYEKWGYIREDLEDIVSVQ